MSAGCRKPDARSFLRMSLSLLLVELLVFPPSLRATGITWNGATGNYSNTAQWTCPGCGGTAAFPKNGNIPGLTFDAFINTGGGEIVNLDGSASGSVINSMTIGSGNIGASTSTLNVAGPNSVTFGSPLVIAGSVLTVNNGAILNVNSGGLLTLDFTGGAR